MVGGSFLKHIKFVLALAFILIWVTGDERKAFAQDAVTRELQQLLTEQGYDPGPVDGFMGRRTEGALKAYQAANGLAVSGKPDAATATLLRQSRAVSPEPEQRTPPPAPQMVRPVTATESNPGVIAGPVDKQESSGEAAQPVLPVMPGPTVPADEPSKNHVGAPPAESQAPLTVAPQLQPKTVALPENQTKSSTSAGVKTWWWIAGILAAVIWLVRRGKKTKASQTADAGSDYLLLLKDQEAAQPKTPKQETPTNRPVSDHPQKRKVFAPLVGNMARTNSSSRWIPYGQSVEVAGRTIGGLVYVGAPPRIGPYEKKCRAYIDPTLSVAKSGNDLEGNGMDYWPSYSEISASSRATYLEWLCSGRKDTAYNPGYLFLYFYGLERRFCEDYSSGEEKKIIFNEVKRLRSIFPDNYSVQKYLGNFLDYASVIVNEVEDKSLLTRRYDVGLPLSLRVLIGIYLEQGKSLDADIVFQWWRLHPESQVRTVARRCPDEFEALFREKFVSRYPKGLSVSKPKRVLKGTYEAASSEFSFDLTPKIGGKELADISNLRKPVTIAQEIADEAMNELDKFSRYLSRNPEGRGSVEAQALLPKELWKLFPSEELDALSGWADAVINDGGLVSLVDIIQRLEGAYPEKVGKRQLTDAADALARLGVGMAPDPRYSLRSPKVGDPVVLFKLPGDDTHLENVTDRYRAALIQLAVGTFIAQADGTVVPSEEAALKNAIICQVDLTPAEQARLFANLKWLLVVPPDMSLLRSKLKAATPDQQKAIRDFAVTMAHADSLLRPEEVGSVEKIYKALGVETADVYSDIHSSAVRDDPVTVRVEQRARNGERLPVEEASPLKLDAGRIAAIQSDTASVSSVLGAIFGNELADEDDEIEESNHSDARFAGLSAGHTAFLSDLILRDHWTDEEFEGLAGKHKLMAAGCLEAINEWAYARFNDALIEEYDGYDLNIDVVQELRESV